MPTMILALLACSEPETSDSAQPPSDSATDSPTDSAIDSDPPDSPADTEPPDSPTDTVDSDPPPAVDPADAPLDPRDFAFLAWPTNFKPWSTGTYETVRHVRTGFYGLAFDVTQGAVTTLGHLSAASPDEVLLEDADVVASLPALTTGWQVTVDGDERAATSFAGRDGSTTNPSELVDMGRFAQRVEIPAVGYDGGGLEGEVTLVAMPRHLVLTQTVTVLDAAKRVTVELELGGDALTALSETTWLEDDRALTVHDGEDGWSFVVPEGATAVRHDDGVSFELTSTEVPAGTVLSLSVLATPTTVGDDQLAVWVDPSSVSVAYEQLTRDGKGTGEQAATYDPERGAWLVTLGDLSDVGATSYANWSDTSTHTWYNRHRVAVSHGVDEASVPLVFEGGNNAAFYIVGGSPLFRDLDGEPTGQPVQISKNWHESPFWYHLYASPTVGSEGHEAELTFAHAKWGEAYAVSHAQLSLVGWGTNQQWDESAIGAFGESITYDPDLTLQRAMVDDVRPFLVEASSAWNWTGNVGGASFLVYEDDAGTKQRLERMRTHYAATGPVLTDVVYAGVSTDGAISAEIRTQLGRTDDLVRAWYHLDYTFLEDVPYSRLAFFQVAADSYGDNLFQQVAWGNAAGVTSTRAVSAHGTTGYASSDDRGLALDGDAPWVLLFDASEDTSSLPEHLADVGYVVRDFEAVLGDDVVTTPHVSLVQTYNGGRSQLAFELGLPFSDELVVPAGSTVRATVEYVVLPSDLDSYYGESDWLGAFETLGGTDVMLRAAEGNQLEVAATVGELVREHPVELEAAVGETAVAFELGGGLGYVPVTVHGLARPDGWQLQQLVDGSWTPVDQAVEGNDFWQAGWDAASDSFRLTWTLPNREVEQYQLVRQ